LANWRARPAPRSKPSGITGGSACCLRPPAPFEAYEEERDAPDWLIAQFNATIALHADRQIYSRDSDFMYRMAHNERVMRGDEFLANQATVRPSEDD
jgi:hypothetical protein